MSTDISGFSFEYPIQSGFAVAGLILVSAVMGGVVLLTLQWALRQARRIFRPRTDRDRSVTAKPLSQRDELVASPRGAQVSAQQFSTGQAEIQAASNVPSVERRSSESGLEESGLEHEAGESGVNKNGSRSEEREYSSSTLSSFSKSHFNHDGNGHDEKLSPKQMHPMLNQAAPLQNGANDSDKLVGIFQNFVDSHKQALALVIGLLIGELIFLFVPDSDWRFFAEVPVSLGLAIASSWLASRLFRDIFDIYLLDTALREGRKLNSEFLILGKFAINGVIILVAVTAFAQTHNINIFGLIASLGIGGLAVAFAAQKTLEQFLGGIVIYLDRPFVVDDYIGLPDGTFGRVESIGLRSTKVRTSGKGTLIVVPNSSLTQVNIENFTGAKKVMSIVYLNLYRLIPDDEKALIRQVILESTSDIFGIDYRSTDITFRPVPQEKQRTQVQVTFFILGSGEVSMELRRQVLDLANQNITQRLSDYGLRFDIDEPTIYVDAPITI